MPTQQIANYRVIRLIGEGGMGLVYEAVRDDIGVRAAIKVLRPEYAHNADVSGRFFNEARAVNMVQHPGVVRVFDYGRLPSGEPYLAMEFLEGMSLRARLMRYLRISEADAMRLGRQIASAVAAAHAKQIVHRDLKPENVMLLEDPEAPGGERAKVLDFGIAKLESGTQGHVRTRTNTMMGTPVYMAPEQCRGLKTITDRADVYSLGVMMFEMVAGQTPFVSENPGDLIAMHMLQAPPSLRSFIPDVDPTLQVLIEGMLTKEPQNRPPMTDVAQQLKALGHLQSDVMPMRVVRSSMAESPRSASVPVPAPVLQNSALPPTAPMPQVRPRTGPQPKPDLAAVAAQPLPGAAGRTDPDATVQMRDSMAPPSATSKKLPGGSVEMEQVSLERQTPVRIPPPAAHDLTRHVGLPSDLTTAMHADEASTVLPKGKKPEQKSRRWPLDLTRYIGKSSDPTTALRADDKSAGLPKLSKEEQKRLERLVFVGMVLVAILLCTLVLLIGSHGDTR